MIFCLVGFFWGVVLFDNVELLKYCVFPFLNWFVQQAPWSWGFPVVDHQGPAHSTRCLPGDNAGSRPIYEQSTVKRTRAALFPAWVAPDVRALADRHLVRVTWRNPWDVTPLSRVRWSKFGRTRNQLIFASDFTGRRPFWSGIKIPDTEHAVCVLNIRFITQVLVFKRLSCQILIET